MHAFLSFTGTLRAISNELLSEEALSTGFFYFNATRTGVMTIFRAFLDGDELPEREFLANSYEKYSTAMAVLRPHLLRAEEEQRVLWLKRPSEKSLEALLRLVRARGQSIPDAPPDTEGDERLQTTDELIARRLEQLGWTAII